MTLKELNDLAERCNTFGMKPEDIQIKFMEGVSELKYNGANACVEVTNAGAKPVLTMKLSSPSRYSQYDR